MPNTPLTATDFASLNADIAEANADATPGDSYTITITGTITDPAFTTSPP
jgi:hypothetical protein